MIEVIHYERANRGKVIGYVDIRLPAWKIIIRKIAHVQGDNSNRWFDLPSFQREKADGSQTYLKFWEFETEIYNSQLLSLLAEKVKEYCMEHKIADIEPISFDIPPIDFEKELPF